MAQPEIFSPKTDLLKHRIVYLDEEIDYFPASEIMASLELLASQSNEKISMLITSPGGDLYPALGIYDTMKSIGKRGIEIHAEARGIAASAAVIVLQGATTRTMTSNSTLIIHEPSMDAGSIQSTNAEDNTKELVRLSKLCMDIMASGSKAASKKLRELCERRPYVWLDAKQSLDLDLVDLIV